MRYANATVVTPDTDAEHTHINVYSWVNDWMDYTFKVSHSQEDEALEVLQRAFDAWHDEDPCVPMFEALEMALTEARIPFESQINVEEESE